MHGMILFQFKKFVVTTANMNMWMRILKKAELKEGQIDYRSEIPDSVFFRAFGIALEELDAEPGAALESFGEFIVPFLMKMFGDKLDPNLNAVEVLALTEKVMHHEAREFSPGVDAQPPRLEIQKISNLELYIRYSSPRNLPQLAQGIINGIAKYTGDHDRLKIAHRSAGKHTTIFRVQLEERKLSPKGVTVEGWASNEKGRRSV